MGNSDGETNVAMTRLRLMCATHGSLSVVLLTSMVLFADPALAQQGAVDARTGTVRIYVSLATSAMTRLVKGLNQHFPNLKIEFVRAGSVETVKRFVAERQAG